MALVLSQLSVLGYANGFTLWHYRGAPDTLAQMSAANYFAAADTMLEPHDLVILSGSDGLRTLRVATVAPGQVSLGFANDEGRYLLQASVPAINAASDTFVPVPIAGIVTRVRAAIDGATTATAVLTPRIGATPMTGGAISVPATAAGSAFSAVPTGLNAVAAGQVLAIGCNGAGGSAARVQVVFEITCA